MTTLHTIVLLVHVLVALFIVGLVLLQRGKGAEAGAAFGAGASGTVFGARGSANFLSRSTAVLAAVFFITSLSLAYLGSQRKPPESLLDSAVPAAPTADMPVLMPTTPGAEGRDDGLPSLPAAPAGKEAEPAPAVPAEDTANPDNQ